MSRGLSNSNTLGGSLILPLSGDRDVRSLVFKAPARIVPSRPRVQRSDSEARIGVIHNVRARRNIARHPPLVVAGCEHAMPRSHAELHDVLGSFAAREIDTLIIDGGDGTVRDVMSAAPRHFPAALPRLAIVPSGKTNALALDLGIPARWTPEDAVRAIAEGHVRERAPIEVARHGAVHADLRGFIFGAGAFARATTLAQTTHRFGAFNGLAVGLSIAAAIGQTLLGGWDNSWRRGEWMLVARNGGGAIDGAQYMVLASTLRQMPLGIKPFGAAREGLKMLRVEAAPRRVVAALPALLGGGSRDWLREAGYHREEATRIDLSLDGGFVLDGETFSGGDLTLREGAPVRFVVP